MYEYGTINIDALFLIIQRLESKIDYLQNKLDALLPARQTTESEWMTLKELQDYIPTHPSESTIRRLVSSRAIPSFRSGRRVLVKKSDVDDWLMRTKRSATHETDDSTSSVVSEQKVSKLHPWRQKANLKIPGVS
ncbi:MAG: helix-turn-helix domain-containing protein [Muribaculaceae bacterium]|nr:helix-turn-helix domain-containing protein [Muribaculaceae bacterium]